MWLGWRNSGVFSLGVLESRGGGGGFFLLKGPLARKVVSSSVGSLVRWLGLGAIAGRDQARSESDRLQLPLCVLERCSAA